MQSNSYNNTSISNLTPHLAAIERFNPNLASDVHRWIPEGLPYDLMDSRDDDNANNVIDGVSGFTFQNLFNALQSDVRSIPVFKARLLQQNNNNQQTQVNALFTEYHY